MCKIGTYNVNVKSAKIIIIIIDYLRSDRFIPRLGKLIDNSHYFRLIAIQHCAKLSRPLSVAPERLYV